MRSTGKSRYEFASATLCDLAKQIIEIKIRQAAQFGKMQAELWATQNERGK